MAACTGGSVHSGDHGHSRMGAHPTSRASVGRLEGGPRRWRLTLACSIALPLSILLACGCSPRPGESEDPASGRAGAGADNARDSAVTLSDESAVSADKDGLPPPRDAILPVPPVHKASLREHSAEKAWVIDGESEPYALELGQAEARGLTLIDLSDTWVPYIFTSKTPGDDNGRPNRYAKRYIDLANDRTDADGDPLPKYRQNFLELYGIPPALSVISKEFERVTGDDQHCLDEAGYDPSVFVESPRSIAFRKKQGSRRLARHRSATKKLRKLMRKAKIARDDFASAAEHPRTSAAYEKWKRLDDEVQIIKQAQIRFSCERLFATRRGKGSSKPGNFDGEVALALAAFEKKHDIRGWGHFTPHNLATLAQSAVESTHARLLRTLRERVISGAGIIEDGSAAETYPDFRWKDAEGNEHPLPDLASEYTQIFIDRLGLGDASTAAARLSELAALSEDGFGQLVVAVHLPDRPAYYSNNMQFEAEIDRGDVWYDFIFDEEGNKIHQPRRRFPHLKLFTHYEGQKIPLVDWRTTIGSWRSEEHDGHVWLAYKNSDIGRRVWKNIAAGPTWIPPMSTPTRGLIKYKIRNGERVPVVNYDETGPSYTSAYGLVAAYHIRQLKNDEGEVIREHDNQIRTHGSVDYMSIMRRYSHGCHRLYNMSAVELFSFILQHRDYLREGQIRIGYRREFEFEEEMFEMELDTRGYRYELTEPIVVNVLEGRIRGKRKKPYKDLIEKPGVDYTEELDETGTGDEFDEAGEFEDPFGFGTGTTGGPTDLTQPGLDPNPASVFDSPGMTPSLDRTGDPEPEPNAAAQPSLPSRPSLRPRSVNDGSKSAIPAGDARSRSERRRMERALRRRDRAERRRRD